MSCDFMVFDPDCAPATAGELRVWYEHQTSWSESHGYADPAICTPALRAWFEQITTGFPAMNGPAADPEPEDPDASEITDYSIGREMIYAAFSWDVSDDAHDAVFEAAQRFRLGVFDTTSEEFWLPGASGLAQL